MARSKLLICLAIHFLVSRSFATDDEQQAVSSPCNYSVEVSDDDEIFGELLIHCCGLENISAVVDEIIDIVDERESAISSLKISHVSFPNLTISSGWYRGDRHIPKLEFQHCAFTSIEPDAFSALGFEPLSSLTLSYIEDVVLSHINMPNALVIRTEHSHIQSIGPEFFRSMTRSVSSISIQSISNSGTTFEFLKVEKFHLLTIILIVGDGNHYSRSLDQTTFSRLPSIKYLMLRKCGIEHIHPNTFEYIRRTLVHVDLSFNKLKSIDPQWMTAILDTFFGVDVLRTIFYSFNPFECDCNLYEIHVLTFYINNEDKHDSFNRGIQSCPADTHYLTCNCSIQSISKDKLLIQDLIFRTSEYLFVKVEMRISNGFLVAITNYKSIFRLLVHNHLGVEMQNRGKCPSREWLELSIRCFIIFGDPKVLPIEDIIRRSNLTTLFAILAVSNKQVWPLHIRTVREPFAKKEDILITAIWIVCLIETIILVLCLFLIIYCKSWMICKKNQREEKEKEPGIISPIEDYEAYCEEHGNRGERGRYRSAVVNADDASNYINIYDSEAVDSSQYYYNEPIGNAMNAVDFPINSDAVPQCPKGISD